MSIENRFLMSANFACLSIYIKIIKSLNLPCYFCFLNKEKKSSFLKRVWSGKSDSRYFIDDPNFGRKFIGVPEGGTLELHGKPKTSWTRLSQTIPELDNIECGVVYNHSSQLVIFRSYNYSFLFSCFLVLFFVVFGLKSHSVIIPIQISLYINLRSKTTVNIFPYKG